MLTGIEAPGERSFLDEGIVCDALLQWHVEAQRGGFFVAAPLARRPVATISETPWNRPRAALL
jgi:hypothetical protein